MGEGGRTRVSGAVDVSMVHQMHGPDGRGVVGVGVALEGAFAAVALGTNSVMQILHISVLNKKERE